MSEGDHARHNSDLVSHRQFGNDRGHARSSGRHPLSILLARQKLSRLEQLQLPQPGTVSGNGLG
jgi:hypothetical protein